MFKDKIALKKALNAVREVIIGTIIAVTIVLLVVGAIWLITYNTFLGLSALVVVVLCSVFITIYMHESEKNKENENESK